MFVDSKLSTNASYYKLPKPGLGPSSSGSNSRGLPIIPVGLILRKAN